MFQEGYTTIQEEVMSNVLDRHDSDPFETMGEVYAYLDGLLQKY